MILACIILLSSCKPDHSEVRLLFTGDILLSRNVKAELNFRKTFPWEHLRNRFHPADLVIGNLEGAVGSAGDQLNHLSGSPVFAIDSSDIELLYKAGFKMITIENNHIFDLGTEGKARTISTLQKNHIKPISFENSPNFIRVKGLVLSFIAINLIPNKHRMKQQLPAIGLKQKLRLAQSLSNLVIVSIHWGSELLEWPNKEQRDAAEWLTSNGADIILGSHPHVVQKPELINGKPVFFSLGNHLFDQKYPETKKGLVAEITIKNGKVYCAGFKTGNRKNSFYPEFLEYDDFSLKPLLFRGHLFTVNDLTLIPFSIDGSNKIVLQAFKKGNLIWNSHPMPLVSIFKFSAGEGKDNLLTLEKHYSTIDNETNIRPYVYSIDHEGLLARWRGSALAWPLLDAVVSPDNDQILCALHRGDAFIMIGNEHKQKRIAAYQWNGFGFKGLSDSVTCKSCKDVFE